MTQEKSGPDATPRIGLDLARQIFDEPSGSDQQTGPSEERIRQRAHEIWEQERRSGDPQEHWYRAEREMGAVGEARAEGRRSSVRQDLSGNGAGRQSVGTAAQKGEGPLRSDDIDE